MSKLQETAPEEIFLIVGPAEETDFKELTDVTWADKPIYEETAIKYVKHPKLSIPKKVAEMLDQEIVADDITKFAMFHEGFERLWLSDDLTSYCVDYKNYALASAYLAGKALGVELVEVSDA